MAVRRYKEVKKEIEPKENMILHTKEKVRLLAVISRCPNSVLIACYLSVIARCMLLLS